MGRLSEKRDEARKLWDALKKIASGSNLEVNISLICAQELERLNDAIQHTDILLALANPQLLPQDLWDNFNAHTQECIIELNIFAQNKSLERLESANSHLDSISSFIKPYVIDDEILAQAIEKALKIDTDKLKTETKSAIDDIQQNKMLSSSLYEEIKESKETTAKLAKKTKETSEALLKEIDVLMSGSTGVSMAKTYIGLKDSFRRKTQYNTAWFFLTLAALGVMAFWFYGDLTDSSDSPLILLQNLLYRLPLITPVLWLAIFFSKRRSEFHRLEQEYLHKESLAKSYYGLKKQIEQLNEPDEELKKKLLSATIDAFAFNAAATLDGKHRDQTPFHEILETAKGFMSSGKKS